MEKEEEWDEGEVNGDTIMCIKNSRETQSKKLNSQLNFQS